MKHENFNLSEINRKHNIKTRFVMFVTDKINNLKSIFITVFLYIFKGKFLEVFNSEKRESFFLNWFGFNDEVKGEHSDYTILERRNRVIKRLMLLTNTFYFLLVYQSGIEQLLHITIIITLLSLFLSNRISKLMSNRDKSLVKEKVIQYLWSIYVLFISFAVYIKLKTASDALSLEYIDAIISNGGTVAEIALTSVFESVSQTGYIVICYALALIALYQDKKLLRHSYLLTFTGIVIMNITILIANGSHFISSPTDILTLFSTDMGKYLMLDIVYKLASIGIFMMVLYGVVVMNETLDKQRKREADKKNEIEHEFMSAVDEVFNVIEVFNQESIAENRDDIYRVGEMSKALSGLIGLSIVEQEEIYNFSVCHANRDNLAELNRNSRILERVQDYKTITRKTKIGSEIIKRVQLNQKCEQLVQSFVGGWERVLLVEESHKLSTTENIILLVDIYDTLRGLRPYKDKYSHQESINFIANNINDKFEPNILRRFLKYNEDFDKMYINNIKK